MQFAPELLRSVTASTYSPAGRPTLLPDRGIWPARNTAKSGFTVGALDATEIWYSRVVGATKRR